MSDDADDLVQRWILAFFEPPALIDVELMTKVLADYEAKDDGKPQ